MARRPSLGRLAPLALVLGGLLVSHELIYVLSHGLGAEYERAMTAGGHDGYWSSFLLIVGLGSLIALLVTAQQLRRLERLAWSTRAAPVVIPDGERRALIAAAFAAWPRLTAVLVGVFVLQENVELWAVGQVPPMVDVLLGHHIAAIPVLAAVGLVAALLRSLVAWRRLVLRLRLTAARTWSRREPVRRRPIQSLPLASRPPVAAHGLRAPPAGNPA